MNNNDVSNDSIVNTQEVKAPEVTRRARVITKDHYVDGDFVTPVKYVCAKCGQEFHVRKEVMYKRIYRLFGGNFEKAMKEMTCSFCKREERELAKAEKKAAKSQNEVQQENAE